MKFDEFDLLFTADLFGNIIARGDYKDFRSFYDPIHQRAREAIVRQTYDFLVEQGIVIDYETPETVARTYLIDLGMPREVDPSELALRALLKRNVGGRA